MGRGGTGVRKVSNSSFEISFSYKGHRCRPRVKIKPTAANRLACERLRDQIIVAIDQGTFDYAETFPSCPNRHKYARLKGQVYTVSQALESWLGDVQPTIKSSTYNGYQKVITGRLIPAFGHITLTELRREDIQRWATRQDITNKTLNNIISPLKQCLNDALGVGHIEFNPLHGWNFKIREAKKKVDDVDPFTADEQARILAELTGQAKNLIQFAFWAGLRTSEYVALDWSDVDLKRGVIVVSKALTQASDAPEAPKTKSGHREVKLLPDALSALLAQKGHTYLKGDEVFQNPRTGERWKGDAPIRKTLWRHAIRKSGVRYRRPYQTRHTYASMMLTAGESPMWVAQQMGHKDWTMIAKVYGRYIPDENSNDGNKAAAMFGNSENKLNKGWTGLHNDV